jgi:hypothetical protein
VSVDYPHPGPPPSRGRGCGAAWPRRSPSWANGMPWRPSRPGTACGRGFALVTGRGMRYDAAAIFRRFQPFRPPISATYSLLARPNPGGAHGSRPSVVPAQPPRPSPWRGPCRTGIARPDPSLGSLRRRGACRRPHRLAAGRNRHRQGAGRTDHPRQRPVRIGAVHRSELCGHPGDVAGS